RPAPVWARAGAARSSSYAESGIRCGACDRYAGASRGRGRSLVAESVENIFCQGDGMATSFERLLGLAATSGLLCAACGAPDPDEPGDDPSSIESVGEELNGSTTLYYE